MQQLNDETGSLIPNPEEVLEVQHMAPVRAFVREDIEDLVIRIITRETGKFSKTHKEIVEDIAFQMTYT